MSDVATVWRGATTPAAPATTGWQRLGGSTPAIAAGAAVVVAALYLGRAVSGRQSLLFLIGAAAGVVLYHAAFGFTSAWRRAITAGRGDGLRAQMLMLAVTCAVFFPLLGQGAV